LCRPGTTRCAGGIDGISITPQRARLAHDNAPDDALTTEVTEVTEDDLLTASRPALMTQASSLLSAPLVSGSGCAAAPFSAACTLSPSPESVKLGRDFTRATLRDWGMSALTDMAELVVSELVTNALRHGIPAACELDGQQVVRLRLLAQAPFAMCMVTDPARTIPVLREADPAAECGRGLTVVDACCVRWGWHLLDEGGKVVWALLR
jgi:anti-sigma regulatory factor (Ser/Thr protein kinase)